MDGRAYRRHKDALANFNKDYIRTEIFPKKLGRKISEAEEIRHASDYDDFYIATREEAEEQMETAAELIEQIEKYCIERMNS
jgi:uncharacterized protein (UPF0332 family)